MTRRPGAKAGAYGVRSAFYSEPQSRAGSVNRSCSEIDTGERTLEEGEDGLYRRDPLDSSIEEERRSVGTQRTERSTQQRGSGAGTAFKQPSKRQQRASVPTQMKIEASAADTRSTGSPRVGDDGDGPPGWWSPLSPISVPQRGQAGHAMPEAQDSKRESRVRMISIEVESVEARRAVTQTSHDQFRQMLRNAKTSIMGTKRQHTILDPERDRGGEASFWRQGTKAEFNSQLT